MIDTAPSQPPAPSRRTWWTVGTAGTALVVLAGVAVAVWPSGSRQSVAAAASAAPVVPPAPAALPRPSASAPNSQWQAWVTQEATAALKRQTAALLAGDLAAYTADAVPGARAELGRRFRTLRSLRVTRFEQLIEGNPWAPASRNGDWRVETVADHCFVDTDCTPDVAEFDTLWRVTARGLRLTGFRVQPPTQACYQCVDHTRTLTRPWQTTELVARAGRRTLVAVPLAQRGRLTELSRRAEAAAAIADRYTVGAGRVDRYRVFVADKASWRRWYSGFPGTWVAGQAVATGRDRIETEVLIGELTDDFADDLLRHELAHVSTLRNNTFYGLEDVWWLVEGMADHVEQAGDPAGAAAERRNLRRFLRSHELTSVAVTPPGSRASDVDAAGRYAVGYFALRHLIGKYGRGKALAFFQQAVQQGIGLETASRSVLGKPWARVDAECLAAIRRV
ncbi:hypothetical protein [Actinoplanes sp. URMC 104]|uniref:hypothetical protein n=1 Tax=Actinoplanes sp. URMC 104 TaxID=3423409 RepID=UPI003F19D762